MPPDENTEIEPQAPQTLREIAKQMERPEREPDLPVDLETRDTDGKVRRYDLEDNEPRWRNERQAAEALQTEREEADERRYEGEKQQAETFEREWRDGVAKISTPVATPEEQQQFSNYNAKMAAHQQRIAQQQAVERSGAAQVAHLNQIGQTAAAMVIARELLAGREQIQKEDAELRHAAEQWQKHAISKSRAANLMEMWRVAPELRDPDVTADFKRWLIKDGVPPSDIEREQSPQMVAQYFKRYKTEREQDYRQRAQRDVARHRLHLRGIGSDRSSESARQSLRERGKVDDALNFFELRRREKAMGL